jgi:hypothetical protein
MQGTSFSESLFEPDSEIFYWLFFIKKESWQAFGISSVITENIG